MFYLMAPASFKDIQKSGNIVLYIGVGIDEGVSHPGLGSQVDDNVKPLS